jgi:beta-glucanase (GH16 family)
MSMCRASFAVVGLLVFLTLCAMLSAPIAQAAVLVWSDELDGTSVDPANWTFETGGGGWGNKELEYYSNGANAKVVGGSLVIEARKERFRANAYTSSRLKTQGKHDFTFGHIESRLAVPMGQGLWPAFWMLGSNISTVPWPGCGEIDIMEHIDNQNTIYGTIHWDNGGHQSFGGSKTVSTPSAFHTYAIDWTSSAITWTVDAASYVTANIANNINGTEEFQKPFFILLNLAVGGTWPGNPDATTVFPADYSIDYVRVSQ